MEKTLVLRFFICTFASRNAEEPSKTDSEAKAMILK